MATTQYLKTNAPLSFMEAGNGLDWVGWGFLPQQVAAAVQNGFQQTNVEGRVMSILPIANVELLKSRLSELPEFERQEYIFEILDESEAISLRDEYQTAAAAEAERQRNTPTDEDIFRAQQLLLLTQISLKLGGEGNV